MTRIEGRRGADEAGRGTGGRRAERGPFARAGSASAAAPVADEIGSTSCCSRGQLQAVSPEPAPARGGAGPGARAKRENTVARDFGQRQRKLGHRVPRSPKKMPLEARRTTVRVGSRAGHQRDGEGRKLAPDSRRKPSEKPGPAEAPAVSSTLSSKSCFWRAKLSKPGLFHRPTLGQSPTPARRARGGGMALLKATHGRERRGWGLGRGAAGPRGRPKKNIRLIKIRGGGPDFRSPFGGRGEKRRSKQKKKKLSFAETGGAPPNGGRATTAPRPGSPGRGPRPGRAGQRVCGSSTAQTAPGGRSRPRRTGSRTLASGGRRLGPSTLVSPKPG